MQAIKRFLSKPINEALFYFLLSFVISVFFAGRQSVSNYLLAAGLAGCLCIFGLWIDYRKNSSDPNASVFKLGEFADYVFWGALILGVLWSGPQDRFFIDLLGFYELDLVLAFLVIRFCYKKDVV